MNWEETILHIRTLPEMADSVYNAYLGEDIADSVVRYRASLEYKETLNKIKQHFGDKKIKVLDIGAGNGITSIALCKEGFKVTALEPDESSVIGAGVIKKYVEENQLLDLEVITSFCEEMNYDQEFDLVIARQSMHHANNLNDFVLNAYKALKKGGLYFAIRDHVLLNASEKEKFFEVHPLHKYYGGENAYTEAEYVGAFTKAGFKVKEVLRYFDSIINHFPLTKEKMEKMHKERALEIEDAFEKKFGKLLKHTPLFRFYKQLFDRKYGTLFDEKDYTGRPYSFLGVKD